MAVPRYTDVANRLTRVPATLPPVDRLQLSLLPVADTCMALMWSRPGGLSLRTTWVTPATIWLCGLVSLLTGIAGIGAIGFGIASGKPIAILAGLLALTVASGAGTLATYGIRQRLLSAPSPPV